MALFFGIFIYQILSSIIDRILKLIYPIHSLQSLDEFWLYDNKDSLSNTSVLITLEKCSQENIKDFIYN